MKIVTTTISRFDLAQTAKNIFGDMVKAVVDINKEIIAIDADLHADLEAVLLQEDSKQSDLWGINLYPELSEDSFIEYDSMINVRPMQGNRSRGVEDPNIRKMISDIVAKRVAQ